VVGLYLDPPENAVILCVDEKPHIQALERAQGWLTLPDGGALKGFSSRYRRHGTTTLFAALEVATGLVKTGHYKRRRRVEFLTFMNQVVADYPEREIHVILDNLNTHKPKRDLWLARHPQVHFHFTPTHASWLNQVEVWFSVLTRSALRTRFTMTPSTGGSRSCSRPGRGTPRGCRRGARSVPAGDGTRAARRSCAPPPSAGDRGQSRARSRDGRSAA